LAWATSASSTATPALWRYPSSIPPLLLFLLLLFFFYSHPSLGMAWLAGPLDAHTWLLCEQDRGGTYPGTFFFSSRLSTIATHIDSFFSLSTTMSATTSTTRRNVVAFQQYYDGHNLESCSFLFVSADKPAVWTTLDALENDTVPRKGKEAISSALFWFYEALSPNHQEPSSDHPMVQAHFEEAQKYAVLFPGFLKYFDMSDFDFITIESDWDEREFSYFANKARAHFGDKAGNTDWICTAEHQLD
jgi:hypothetical protein